MKRTALARRTPLSRGVVQLKRTLLRRKSLIIKIVDEKKITPVFKIKVWGTPYADSLFSLFIRKRDGKCLRCGTKDNLTNSHYWRRGHSGTRFDPENCIALCQDCHSLWENLKNDTYQQFMLDWLGKERYDALEKRARTFMKRRDAVIKFMEYHKSLSHSGSFAK